MPFSLGAHAQTCFDMRLTEFQFHVTRFARNTYTLEDSFFSIQGTTVFPNFQACQSFTQKVNSKRKEQGISETNYARTAEVFAASLLHEVYHFVISVYIDDVKPNVFQECESWVRTEFSSDAINAFLLRFTDIFPPLTVYRGAETPSQYLLRSTDATPNTEVSLEELMLVWLENQNPALTQIGDLIDDEVLVKETPYNKILSSIDNFFVTQPVFGNEQLPLLRLLLAPIKSSPNSILEQLQYVLVNWDSIISRSPTLKKLLLQSSDFVREEGKYFEMLESALSDKAKLPQEVKPVHFFGDFEKETPPVPNYKSTFYEDAPENFTADLNWMPRLVLIAKNTYVWLDQLSKKYQRPINHLDQIPDDELDILVRSGFTGLWFIGIWERSYASKKIKHLNGNIDAVASAYSLNDYVIATDLGGQEAFEKLKERARKKGLRLASDMVPNHMGIDSSWVINHPDWFLSLDYPPFPNYTFHGTDLSTDPRVGIFIEDGYWRKTDAAVVFARLDRWTGDVKYVYHGNDGTIMPWNDTAQLNYLKAEVREQVIQTILRVARSFPVIRFDAAMVLAKQHIERLWFPEPGKGGAIPSRAAFAMTREEFDKAMPVEFWREVVDRVQQELPDTLLLAEAFWMLEGYFVRTLGMHRVYNSAFMHMFKKEENAEYRKLIKDTLEYDIRILKRYVNFMNNPDEETAVKQFGKGDKYFGVCVMLATMPGLPMFGHGQIEGFSEKYGMEYQRAYQHEVPDEWLIARHEKEIFPILKRRHLFAEVDYFFLYDFITMSGINENVFAYSNRTQIEKGIVIFNNNWEATSGWIKVSSPYLDLEKNKLSQKVLAEGLDISLNSSIYLVFRDQITGLEYIRSNRELWEKGMYFDLPAYKYHVLLDFEEVTSSSLFPYDELARQLNGAGVPSIKDAVLELSLRPVHAAIQELFNPETLLHLKENKAGSAKLLKDKLSSLRKAMLSVQPDIKFPTEIVPETLERYQGLTELQKIGNIKTIASSSVGEYISSSVFPLETTKHSNWRIALGWTLLHSFNKVENPQANNLMTDFRLGKFISKTLEQLGLTEDRAKTETDLIRLMLDFSKYPKTTLLDTLREMLESQKVSSFLKVNKYNGIVYFNKERFELFLSGLFTLLSIDKTVLNGLNLETLSSVYREVIIQQELAEKVEFKFNDLILAMSDSEMQPPANPKNIAKQNRDKKMNDLNESKEDLETELRFNLSVKKGIAKKSLPQKLKTKKAPQSKKEPVTKNTKPAKTRSVTKDNIKTTPKTKSAKKLNTLSTTPLKKSEVGKKLEKKNALALKPLGKVKTKDSKVKKIGKKIDSKSNKEKSTGKKRKS